MSYTNLIFVDNVHTKVRVVPGGHRENQRAASEAVDRGGFHRVHPFGSGRTPTAFRRRRFHQEPEG